MSFVTAKGLNKKQLRQEGQCQSHLGTVQARCLRLAMRQQADDPVSSHAPWHVPPA